MKRYLLLFTVMVIVASACIKDRVAAPGSSNNIPPVTDSNDVMIHYWNFNTDSAHILIPTLTIGGASLGYTGAYYDTVQPGSTLNLQSGDSVGASLRLRNPASGPFTLTLPTTGYKNIILKYAVERTSKGAQENIVTYTTDGVNYINTAIAQQASYTLDTAFTLIGFDFSSDPNVNNNPKFKVQINFATGSTNTSGNDRFDNLTLQGVKE